jgi:hypothetical protein
VKALRILFAIALLSGTAATAQRPPYMTPNAPMLGSAWYPEQWPESTWDRDLTLMEQAHMNVVRIGEFAWSTEEPNENHFDLAWLDRAIALAAKHHLVVVMSTPTDAPPAWLTAKYPDTLGMNADGHYREHGNRRQFNYASPHYRQLCSRIVNQLAKRFGHNPNILGWQIGNEYTDESFDPATRTQFQQFLRTKYKTLDNLNAHWTTAYWSETYTDWSQIPLESTYGNPGLLLEHKHFVTAAWRSFQREQIDILRPFNPAIAVHHHQHRRPRLERQLGPLRHHRRPRPRQLGRLRRPGTPQRPPQRHAQRLRPRLEAPEFLDHGNPARLRQLGAHQQRPRPRRNPRPRMASHRPRSRRHPLLAVA